MHQAAVGCLGSAFLRSYPTRRRQESNSRKKLLRELSSQSFPTPVLSTLAARQYDRRNATNSLVTHAAS